MKENSLIIIKHSIYTIFEPELNRIRRYASQFAAALAINLLKFSVGSFHGLTTVIIAKFYTENNEMKMTLREVTWFSSYCFLLPIGFSISIVLAQIIGSRRTMLVASIVYILCSLTFFFSTDVVMLLTAQAGIGLGVPMMAGPSCVYITEIAQPHLRSILIGTGYLILITAECLTILMANFIHWRTIVLVNITFPILGFLTICMLPESPLWLAVNGNMDQAEVALSWLRGWTKSHFIETELKSLKDNYKIASNNETTSISGKCFKTILKSYLTKSFLLPLASIIYMFFANAISGALALQAYSIVIFKMMDSPIDKYTATIIFNITRGIGTFSCVFIIHYTGKRKLLFFGLISSALSYLIIALVLVLREKESAVSVVYSWITVVMFFISTFLTALGCDKIIFMLNSEIFPTKFRNIGTGIGFIGFSIFFSIANKAFLFIVDILTLQGTFLFFAISSFISFFSFYFMIPETEGRSLNEIEEHYAGVINIQNKKLSLKEKLRV